MRTRLSPVFISLFVFLSAFTVLLSLSIFLKAVRVPNGNVSNISNSSELNDSGTPTNESTMIPYDSETDETLEQTPELQSENRAAASCSYRPSLDQTDQDDYTIEGFQWRSSHAYKKTKVNRLTLQLSEISAVMSMASLFGPEVHLDISKLRRIRSEDFEWSTTIVLARRPEVRAAVEEGLAVITGKVVLCTQGGLRDEV